MLTCLQPFLAFALCVCYFVSEPSLAFPLNLHAWVRLSWPCPLCGFAFALEKILQKYI